MASNASFVQTCAPVALTAIALRGQRVSLVQTCGPATLASTGTLGRVVRVTTATAEARLTAAATLGPRPDVVILPARLYNLTGPVRSGGGAILCFVGPPWKTVEWRMVEGDGTLTPFTTYTDALGRASCRFDPAYTPSKARVVVGAAYVP